jgi:hypothetical protein
MFVAFIETDGIIFTSDEEQSFDEFVQDIIEREAPYYDFRVVDLQFAAIIPVEFSIKRKDH